VNGTEQAEVVAFRAASVHGEPAIDPVAVPVLENATAPRGGEAVPTELVSLTRAVQIVTWSTIIPEGEHSTAVEVVRRVAATVLLVPELFACTSSFGV
jgi:hypothetical protein